MLTTGCQVLTLRHHVILKRPNKVSIGSHDLEARTWNPKQHCLYCQEKKASSLIKEGCVHASESERSACNTETAVPGSLTMAERLWSLSPLSSYLQGQSGEHIKCDLALKDFSNSIALKHIIEHTINRNLSQKKQRNKQKNYTVPLTFQSTE